MDEAPEGPAESNLARSGHKTQETGEGINGMVEFRRRELRVERESGSCVS